MDKTPATYTQELLKFITKNYDDKEKNSLLQGVIIKDQNVITPKIFANATEVTTCNNQRKKEIKIFEHILALVVQVYYSNDHYITIKNINQVKQKHLKSTQKKRAIKKIPKSQNQQKILNILLSPLKKDLEYGKLKRKLDTKRNSYI